MPSLRTRLGKAVIGLGIVLLDMEIYLLSEIAHRRGLAYCYAIVARSYSFCNRKSGIASSVAMHFSEVGLGISGMFCCLAFGNQSTHYTGECFHRRALNSVS